MTYKQDSRVNGPNKKYDAIVVGAGPAGSTAAYLLAKRGFKVLILDKSGFPRSKLCGGLLTRKTVKLVEDIFRTSPDYLVSHGIIADQSTDYGVCLGSQEYIRGKLEYPFHFVDRRIYDEFWLNRAQQAGAEFRSGHKVISLEPSTNQVVTADGHRFKGTFILGADGATSRLLRLLSARGLIENDYRTGLATALELVVPADISAGLPDYPTIYFGHIRWGYAWCFPRKDLRILGICGLNRKSGKYLKRGLTQFLHKIEIETDHIPAVKSHALPYGNYLNQPCTADILLLGDACGLADPLLGEGIYYAHKSGQLAALAIIQSYGNSTDAGRLYRRYLHAQIIPDLKFARIGRQIVFSLPGSWPGFIFSTIIKINPRICEETIQGQRTFHWLRPVQPGSR